MTRFRSSGRPDWWPRFERIDWGLVGLILIAAALDAAMIAALCFGVM